MSGYHVELNQLFSGDFSGFSESVQDNLDISRVTTAPFRIPSKQPFTS